MNQSTKLHNPMSAETKAKISITKLGVRKGAYKSHIENKTKSDFGTQLRLARNVAGYTLKEIAEKLDTTFAQIAEWEWGSRLPKARALFKMAQLYNDDSLFDFFLAQKLNEKKFKNKVGKILYASRIRMGITIESTSKHLKIKAEKIRRWEYGNAIPRIHDIVKLSVYYWDEILIDKIVIQIKKEVKI